MPTPKTECTELSVGFGLLGLDPLETSVERIASYWAGTLSPKKFGEFKVEFTQEESYYRRFYAIGLNLRRSHKLFKTTSMTSVRWEGPQQQARSVSMAKDLIFANTPVSVKDESNIVLNPSPHILFISIPSGTPHPTKSENWYLTVAPDAYQSLYSFARQLCVLDLPDSIEKYHKVIRKPQRKRFQAAIKSLAIADAAAFKNQYISFCHEVAQKSAGFFTRTLSQWLSGSLKNSVSENIIRNFFSS